MNPLEIVLIIIGILVIIISCRLTDQSSKHSQPAEGGMKLSDHLTEEDKRQLKDKMNELLAEVSEETITHTDDTLSRISNEKILVVNEFSEQLLEKINRNHEEVVFLYNMLSDKEKELKEAVKEIDISKKKLQDIMDSKSAIEQLTAVKNTKTQTTPKPAALSKADYLEESSKAVSRQPQKSVTSPADNGFGTNNNNKQILSLYSQGKSVIEISKLLGLGQGEVKLVIDLFKGKK